MSDTAATGCGHPNHGNNDHDCTPFAASDQPLGINSDTLDLPPARAAAERVGEFLRWYGDGRVFIGVGEWGPPLYARDLEVLARAAAREGH